MGTILQDVRYAIRRLLKSPAFTLVAMLSLALGIGANTAIFTLMDQVLLRLLPVKNPRELVLLNTQGANFGAVYGPNAFSYPMYRDFRDRAPVFSGVLARRAVDLSLTFRGHTERVAGDLVSGNYFEVLGVQPALGRAFTQDDDRTPGGHPVAVLSHSFWKRRFAGDPGILGRAINLNGHPMTVVGVAPPDFHGIEVGYSADVMVPMMMKRQMTPNWDDMENRRSAWVTVMGRLKPGVTPQQAEQVLTAFWRPILQEELKEMPADLPQSFRGQFVEKRVTLEPGQKGRSFLRDQFSAQLLVLMGMVGLVLLIACGNIANLLLARAAARQKEIAVRTALGASRPRMVRQLLVESVVLAVGGGALGLILASWAGAALIRFLPFDSAAITLSSDPDTRVLLFNFGLSVLTGLLFGLTPAIQGTRSDVASALKDQALNVSGGFGHARIRKTLVAAQVALSLVLLIGAGLFARSLYNLKGVDPGFRPDHLLTFTVDPSLSGYNRQRMLAFYEQVQNDIGAMPGVRSVSMASGPLMRGNRNQMTVGVEGYRAKEGEDMNPDLNEVGPGFFRTLGVPVIAGREFTNRDRDGAPKVAVINQTMARRYFGTVSPLGRHLAFGPPDARLEVEIVGVVRDTRPDDLRDPVRRQVFTPYTQPEYLGALTFYVRSAGDSASLGPAVRNRVRRLDPDLPVYNTRTMQVEIDHHLYQERIVATLSGFFGVLATLLAALGLYGVMAYAVASRTREIGIRVALGANRGSVVRMVMTEVWLMAGIGIAVALPVAFALGRYIESQLFGIKSGDPLVMGGATVVLALVAMMAGYLPARRATRVDPLTALRYE